MFAALLGDEENGHWRLAPRSGGTCTSRRYRGDTMVLETEWAGPTGTVRVIDFMPERDEAPDVVRIVEGVAGRVEMRSELRLRFGYGDDGPVGAPPRRRCSPRSPGRTRSGWPRDVPHHGRDFASYADFTVEAGGAGRVRAHLEPVVPAPPAPVRPARALADTERFWRRWARPLHLRRARTATRCCARCSR